MTDEPLKPKLSTQTTPSSARNLGPLKLHTYGSYDSATQRSATPSARIRISQIEDRKVESSNLKMNDFYFGKFYKVPDKVRGKINEKLRDMRKDYGSFRKYLNKIEVGVLLFKKKAEQLEQ